MLGGAFNAIRPAVWRLLGAKEKVAVLLEKPPAHIKVLGNQLWFCCPSQAE